LELGGKAQRFRFLSSQGLAAFLDGVGLIKEAFVLLVFLAAPLEAVVAYVEIVHVIDCVLSNLGLSLGGAVSMPCGGNAANASLGRMLDAGKPLLSEFPLFVVELLLEEIPASFDHAFLRLVGHLRLVGGSVDCRRVEIAFCRHFEVYRIRHEKHRRLVSYGCTHHGAQEAYVSIVWRALAPTGLARAQKLVFYQRLVVVRVWCLKREVADRGLHRILLLLLIICLSYDLVINGVNELDNELILNAVISLGSDRWCFVLLLLKCEVIVLDDVRSDDLLLQVVSRLEHERVACAMVLTTHNAMLGADLVL